MASLSQAFLIFFFLRTIRSERVYDLSHQIVPKMPNRVNYLLDFNQSGINAEFSLKRQSFCALENAGTHLNAPFKVNEDRWTVNEIPVDHLIAPLFIISSTTNVNENVIQNWEKIHGNIPQGSVVALRSRETNPWHQGHDAYLGITRRRLTPKYAGFEEDACRYLVSESRRVVGVGVDTLAVDGNKIDNRLWPCQNILAEHDVYVLENLNLDNVPVNGTTIFVGALNLDFGTGSPARILALDSTFEMTTRSPSLGGETPVTTTSTTHLGDIATTTKSSFGNKINNDARYCLFLFALVFRQLL